MKAVLIISITGIALSGCARQLQETAGLGLLAGGVLVSSIAGREPFQPPPDEQDRWQKDGATNTDIVTALLECGDQQPRALLPYGVRKNLPPFTPNDEAMERHCMEAAGYVTNHDNSWRGYCGRQHDSEQYPACAPNATIPQRSANKRLASEFCRVYPKADVCLP
jgi:hypothetical protein